MSEKDDPQKFLGLSHHQLKTDVNELDADTREKYYKFSIGPWSPRWRRKVIFLHGFPYL